MPETSEVTSLLSTALCHALEHGPKVCHCRSASSSLCRHSSSEVVPPPPSPVEAFGGVLPPPWLSSSVKVLQVFDHINGPHGARCVLKVGDVCLCRRFGQGDTGNVVDSTLHHCATSGASGASHNPTTRQASSRTPSSAREVHLAGDTRPRTPARSRGVIRPASEPKKLSRRIRRATASRKFERWARTMATW